MPLDTIMRQLLQQYVADRQYIARLRELIPEEQRTEIGEPPEFLEPGVRGLIEELVFYAGLVQQYEAVARGDGEAKPEEAGAGLAGPDHAGARDARQPAGQQDSS